jgi:adenylate kinase
LRIVILGPPGSGKGTCAKIIGEIYDVPVITTGDMLREAVEKGTTLGNTAKSYMDRGELVPDDLVIFLVKERIAEPDASRGFILDGYPRSVKQAEALERIFGDSSKKLDHVINVQLEDNVIIERLSMRRICPKCGSIYHLKNKPPKVDRKCDKCSSKLLQREDDKEDVIKRRLEVYREKTQPLLNWYAERVGVKTIRGDLSLDELPSTLKKLIS